MKNENLKVFIIFTFLCLKIPHKCHLLAPPPTIFTIASYEYQEYYRLGSKRVSENFPEKSNKGPRLLWMRSDCTFPRVGSANVQTNDWQVDKVPDKLSPTLNLTTRVPSLVLKPERECSPSRQRLVTEKSCWSSNLSAKPSKDTDDTFIGLVN